MLRNQIYEDMKQAMKDKAAERLETVRFVWSEIKNAEIDAKHELTDEEVVSLLQREMKRRREAVEQFTKGGREELAAEELKKMAVIEEYLPEQMSREEIAVLVDSVVAGGARDFGQVMSMVMAKVKGKADGKLVAEVVKEKMG